MKATFEIPDDIYRRAKARSAMEGRPLRSVAVELFQNWLSAQPDPQAPQPSLPDYPPTRFDNAPWTAVIRPYLRPGMNHDPAGISEAISRGWGQDAAEKLTTYDK